MTIEQIRQHWQPARLISPNGMRGHDEQEMRATSSLLAVMGIVPDFARAITARLGAPAGRLSAYTEVEFELPSGAKVRPDGVLVVERGSTRWIALIEVKTGTNELGRDQVEAYLDIAREHNLDCVATISNQVLGSTSLAPVEVDRRKTRRVNLAHLSWLEIITEAAFQHEQRGISDPEQAYILGELIRYLEDSRSGAMKFEDMGSEWVTVRDGARDGTLRLNDKSVVEVSARWDQLLQFLALDLGRGVGAPVREMLTLQERRDPSLRKSALQKQLVESGLLSGSLRIPGAVGDVLLTASLRSRQISAAITIAAPNSGRPNTQARWLLRQLASAPDSLRIEVWFHGTRKTTACLIKEARENETLLIGDGKADPRIFTITLNSTMGDSRNNRKGSFIDSMVDLLSRFYRDVAQVLRPWQPSAPKLKQPELSGDVVPVVISSVSELPNLEEYSDLQIVDAPVALTPEPK